MEMEREREREGGTQTQTCRQRQNRILMRPRRRKRGNRPAAEARLSPRGADEEEGGDEGERHTSRPAAREREGG